MHSHIQHCLLNTYFVPDTVACAKDTTVNRKYRICILIELGGGDRQQTQKQYIVCQCIHLMI